MGLFDFVKSIGNKIFNKEEEAAQKIKEHIEEQNPGVKDLNVEYREGTVKLTGNSDSPEAVEKAILMAGNIRGVGNIETDINSPKQTEKVEYYVIEKGDTLSGIAKKYYGDAMAYPRIFKANTEVIKDPDKIFIGQKIRIPLS
jgi:nucleoid-associated protein YgaU